MGGLFLVYKKVLKTGSVLIRGKCIVPPYTNTSRLFQVETTWRRPLPGRFNVEYTWCVCMASDMKEMPYICQSNRQNCQKFMDIICDIQENQKLNIKR